MEKEQFFQDIYFSKGSKFKHIRIEFDGSCGPDNPLGNMGYGYAIFDVGSESLLAEGWGYTLYDGSEGTSNNLAEWTAIAKGLELLYECGFIYDQLSIFGDSMLVIRQMLGQWRVKGGMYAHMALYVLDQFGEDIKKAEVYHKRRDYNEYCDALSNKYIDHLSNNFGVNTGGEYNPKKLVQNKYYKQKIR